MRMELLSIIILHIILAMAAEQNLLCVHDVRSSNTNTSLLYHEGTRKCFPAFVKCNGLMLFYPAGDGYGECDCDLELERLEGRDILYWPPHNRCYRLHEIGPCRRREWLELDEETGRAVCAANPCFVAQRKYTTLNTQDFWFYEHGKCWKNGMLGHCPEIPGFRIYYGNIDFDKHGNCIMFGAGGSIVSTDTLPCKRGHKYYGNSRICKRAQKIASNYASLD